MADSVAGLSPNAAGCEDQKGEFYTSGVIAVASIRDGTGEQRIFHGFTCLSWEEPLEIQQFSHER